MDPGGFSLGWAVTLLSHQKSEELSCLQGGPLTAWQSFPSHALQRVFCLWEVIISLGTIGCGLDKARRMSFNVLLWWLDCRQKQNKAFTSFFVAVKFGESFFQTSGKPLFHVRIMPSLKCLDQEGKGHKSWSLLRVHQTPGLQFLISAGCCRAGSFPLACQRSKHASLSCWFCQNFFPENKQFSYSKAAFPPEQSWLEWTTVFIEEMCCNSLAFPTVCAPGAQSVWESRALNFYHHLWSLAQPKDVRNW